MTKNRQLKNARLELLTEFKPKTENQEDYVRAIAENDVVFCTGPAGTGKTTIPTAIACRCLVEEEIEKVIITRPVIESGRGLGFLPGGFEEKIHPYLVPILDEMHKYIGYQWTKHLIYDRRIEIVPLEYMRGRNLHNSFCILDEAQNASESQIKMFLTRMGSTSNCVVNGDTRQSDLPEREQGALAKCIRRLEGCEDVAIVKLDDSDIIRHRVISRILSRLERETEIDTYYG